MRKFEGVVMIPHKVEFGIEGSKVTPKQIGERAHKLVEQLGSIDDIHSLLLWVREVSHDDSPPAPYVPPSAA